MFPHSVKLYFFIKLNWLSDVDWVFYSPHVLIPSKDEHDDISLLSMSTLTLCYRQASALTSSGLPEALLCSAPLPSFESSNPPPTDVDCGNGELKACVTSCGRRPEIMGRPAGDGSATAGDGMSGEAEGRRSIWAWALRPAEINLSATSTNSVMDQANEPRPPTLCLSPRSSDCAGDFHPWIEAGSKFGNIDGKIPVEFGNLRKRSEEGEIVFIFEFFYRFRFRFLDADAVFN